MKTSLATLNYSFLFVIISNLVLEATAFKVFIKTFETSNCLIFLIHSFFILVICELIKPCGWVAHIGKCSRLAPPLRPVILSIHGHCRNVALASRSEWRYLPTKIR